jgi:hypothetical protein
MFSLNRKLIPFFISQTGVIPWEEATIVEDWNSKTISVCAPHLSDIAKIVSSIVASRPENLRHVIRCRIAPIPEAPTRSQLRLLEATMSKDLPGFNNTTAKVEKDHVFTTSELVDLRSVDLHYLTDYRRTVLLETEAELNATSSEYNLFTSITEFGGAGIARLRELAPSCGVLRLIESETHSVLQVIGSSEVAGRAFRTLKDGGVRQITDLKTVPRKIARWTAKDRGRFKAIL